MCMFGLKYFRLRQNVKHLYKLLTCACDLSLFGVLISLIYKTSGVSPLSSLQSFYCGWGNFSTWTLIYLHIISVSTPFRGQTTVTSCHLCLTALLSTLLLPYPLILTDLSGCLAGPWFSSPCPFSGLSCRLLLALTSPVPCLLYSSLLHGLGYPFHTAHLLSLVHCFPLGLSLPFSWHSSQ